jgi:hypothetical protein
MRDEEGNHGCLRGVLVLSESWQFNCYHACRCTCYLRTSGSVLVAELLLVTSVRFCISSRSVCVCVCVCVCVLFLCDSYLEIIASLLREVPAMLLVKF